MLVEMASIVKMIFSCRTGHASVNMAWKTGCWQSMYVAGVHNIYMLNG